LFRSLAVTARYPQLGAFSCASADLPPSSHMRYILCRLLHRFSRLLVAGKTFHWRGCWVAPQVLHRALVSRSTPVPPHRRRGRRGEPHINPVGTGMFPSANNHIFVPSKKMSSEAKTLLDVLRSRSAVDCDTFDDHGRKPAHVLCRKEKNMD
jgi:hypothetical protein